MAKPKTQVTRNKRTGAQTSGNPNALNSYINNHLKVSTLSFKEQIDQPFATFFTCSAIGVALVLPALLFILLSNLYNANLDWEGSAQITLFLEPTVSELEAGVFSSNLTKRSSIEKTRFINKEQALEDFKSQFEIDNVIDFLEDNPLPHAIVVTPSESASQLHQLEQLKEELDKLEKVESSLLDAIWVQRLQSITRFIERSILVLAIMLSMAVLLILGNTIRLAIENRKEEIVVLKLVGGTHGFVRRPFLYMGVLYGLGGSLIASVITSIIIAVLYGPLETLANSYHSNFSLSGMGFESTLLLIVCGTGLGWLGAWLAVRKHLDDIEPT